MALKKRTRRLLIALLILPLAAWFGLQIVISSIVRGRLQTLVSAQLNGAQLQIGRVRYEFPYGMRLRNVRVSGIDGEDLFRAERIYLDFGQWPLRKGPLVIRSLLLDQPVLSLACRSDGQLNLSTIFKRPAGSDQPSPSSSRLSDRLRLGWLSIRGGRLDYQDQRKPHFKPLLWDDLHADVQLAEQSARQYSWQISGLGGGQIELKAAGTIDVDELLLDVSSLRISARLDSQSAQDAGLFPPAAQELLRMLDAQGSFRLRAAALIPLRRLNEASVHGEFELIGLLTALNGHPLATDVLAGFDKRPSSPVISLEILKLDAKTPSGPIELSPVRLAVNVSEGLLQADQIAVNYAGDRFLLAGLHLPLTNLDQPVGLRDVALTVELQQPGPPYPGALGGILATLRPAGRLDVRGRCALSQNGIEDYEFTIKADDASLTIGQTSPPITDVQAEVFLTPACAQIRRFLGKVLDGQLLAAGNVWMQPSMRYEGEIELSNIDMNELSKTCSLSSNETIRLSGRGYARASVVGQGAHLAGLTAQGQMQIIDGDLWMLPALGQIARRVKIAREGLTAGQAAAVFDVQQERVHLRRAAVNSPLLGLQGSGTIGFDGQLDLNVIAAPLGDWRQHMQKTGIPLVSGAAAEIAGRVQKLINTASGKLLYEFRLKGSASSPQIETVPAPILSDAGAILFSRMLRQGENLLELLREKKE